MKPKDLLIWAACVAIIVGAVTAFSLALRMGNAPAPISPMSGASEHSVSPVAATYPPVLLEAAAAMATYYAPTPTRTPTAPTATLMPTMTIDFCGPSAKKGRLCTWPNFTPTPAPPTPACETPVPLKECRWLGMSAPIGTPVLVMQ